MFAGSALEFYLVVEVEVAVEAVILCSKWLCNVNVMDGVMTANFYSFFHRTITVTNGRIIVNICFPTPRLWGNVEK